LLLYIIMFNYHNNTTVRNVYFDIVNGIFNDCDLNDCYIDNNYDADYEDNQDEE